MTTASITFSGLASGLDTSSLIKQLVKVEQQPIVQLQTRQSNLNSVSSKLSNIKSLLSALQDKADALNSRDEVIGTVATSSAESYVTATATGEIAAGSYEVTVESLANAARVRSNAFSAKDEGGLFDINYFTLQVGDGDEQKFEIDTTTTLESLADDINSRSGLRVRAGVIFDGTSYRLQINALDVGADNVLTIVEDGGSLGLNDNVVQEAADAVFYVDELRMTSSSNTVDDAIPGLSLQLKAEGTAQVEVADDTSGVQTKIEEFVTAYNAVMTAINAEFAYTGAANTRDSLAGDTTLRNLQRVLSQQISQTVSGLSGTYNRLYTIGITTQRDGTLSFDATKLSAAISADAEGVANLFIDNTTAGTTGVMASLSGIIDTYIQASTGALSIKIDNIAKRVSDMDDQIDRLQARVDKYEETLTARFAAMEQLISSLRNQSSQMEAIFDQLSNNKK
jgi:flagellar hook-associated protein 2